MNRKLLQLLLPLMLVSCHGSDPQGSVFVQTDPIITNVSLLHMNVADMDRSLAWYQDVLGMENVGGNGGPLATPTVPEPGALMRTEVLSPPGSELEIELVEVSGIELRPQQPNIQDPGAIMLAVVVNDLDLALAGARRLGLEVLSERGEAVFTEERGRQVMVRDADGFVTYITQSTEPSAATISIAFIFMSVADLNETIAFYNGVFGMNLEPPNNLGPIPARIAALIDNAELVEFRLGEDYIFPGAAGAMLLQEFRGGEREAVRHRVQDPGGPIITMNSYDLHGLLERVEGFGGTIGMEETSSPVSPDATFAWFRDPNGLLMRVTASE
jgi:catechol 2,3-dioxygenase-like lactoylglutathione lyase family enzyme